jgi:hypothetical protein
MLFTQVAFADTIELNQLGIRYRSFFPGGVDPLITQSGLRHNLDKEVALIMDIDLIGDCFWNNVVHSRTDTDNLGGGQFRTVGWQFDLGCHVFRNFDVYYGHHSQHLMDYNSTVWDHFPVEDSIGFTIWVFRAKPSWKGIF